jgi:hypothetical protein
VNFPGRRVIREHNPFGSSDNGQARFSGAGPLAGTGRRRWMRIGHDTRHNVHRFSPDYSLIELCLPAGYSTIGRPALVEP